MSSGAVSRWSGVCQRRKTLLGEEGDDVDLAGGSAILPKGPSYQSPLTLCTHDCESSWLHMDGDLLLQKLHEGMHLCERSTTGRIDGPQI